MKSRAHKSVKTVRRMHSTIAAQMNKAGKKDETSSAKLFFSQYDMALVQSGFFGAVLLYPDGFGIKCSQEELTDYIFFWRGLGYLMGVDDRYNLCDGTFDEIHSLIKEIEQDLLLPSLKSPPNEFEMMSEAYVEGTNRSKRRFMTKEAIFALVAEGMGLYLPEMTMLDYSRYLCLKSIIFLTRWCPLFARMLNKLTKIMFYNELHKLKMY